MRRYRQISGEECRGVYMCSPDCDELDLPRRRYQGRDRLEIRMSDSTSDSPKPGDRLDNYETKIRNRETCLEEAGFTVSSVVYTAACIDRIYKH